MERQRGYMFLDPTNARTAAQLGAPAAKKKSYRWDFYQQVGSKFRGAWSRLLVQAGTLGRAAQ